MINLTGLEQHTAIDGHKFSEIVQKDLDNQIAILEHANIDLKASIDSKKKSVDVYTQAKTDTSSFRAAQLEAIKAGIVESKMVLKSNQSLVRNIEKGSDKIKKMRKTSAITSYGIGHMTTYLEEFLKTIGHRNNTINRYIETLEKDKNSYEHTTDEATLELFKNLLVVTKKLIKDEESTIEENKAHIKELKSLKELVRKKKILAF